MNKVLDLKINCRSSKVDTQLVQKNCLTNYARSKRTVGKVQFAHKNYSTSSARSKRTVRKVQLVQKNCLNSSVHWTDRFKQFISSEGNLNVGSPNYDSPLSLSRDIASTRHNIHQVLREAYLSKGIMESRNLFSYKHNSLSSTR